MDRGSYFGVVTGTSSGMPEGAPDFSAREAYYRQGYAADQDKEKSIAIEVAGRGSCFEQTYGQYQQKKDPPGDQ
jgi:hypothetical protein